MNELIGEVEAATGGRDEQDEQHGDDGKRQRRGERAEAADGGGATTEAGGSATFALSMSAWRADFDTITVTVSGTPACGKKVDLTGVRSEAAREQLHAQALAEAKMMGKLSHLHVVRLYGCCIDAERTLWIVMEFMANGALDQYAERRAREGRPLAPVERLELALGARVVHHGDADGAHFALRE